MKKIFVTLMLCIMTIAASAQIKSVDVKADLRGDFGLGAGITMGIVDKIDFAPRFNYYFAGHGANLFTIDADFHYNIPVAESFKVYPAVGLVYLHATGFNKVGVNLGAGAQYSITDNLGAFIEAKYQWVDGWDDTYFSLGVNIGI